MQTKHIITEEYWQAMRTYVPRLCCHAAASPRSRMRFSEGGESHV